MQANERWFRLVERGAWVTGVVAIVVWAVTSLAGIASANQDLQRFERLKSSSNSRVISVQPDVSDWDAKRILAWQATLAQPGPEPIGVLRIPKARLEVAILQGTSDFVLDRAVGHIEDTALPGGDGNSGIAGHRDGFFRGLKDIAVGDAIEIETLEGTQVYHVEQTWIVSPDDVWVLDPTSTRSITLVTCYPFYFVGPAPQRFIVRAVSANTTPR